MGLNSFQTSGNSPGHRRCRVGILGFGAVGSAVAARLLSDPPGATSLELTHICDRRAREKRARNERAETASPAHPAPIWTDRFDDLLASDIDILVEAITEPAIDYVRAALLAGKSVVTANKQVIAQQGPALLALAERQGRQLRFEAAVGGAMPIVRVLGEGLAGEPVLKIDAILNGTSNAVLSRMEELGCTMDEAVADACARGYAELSPSTDLDGLDAAAKLSILCGLGFGLRVLPSQIETKTTAGVGAPEFREARLRGGTLRQVAHAEYDAVTGRLGAWVAPVFVPGASVFAQTKGPGNAAVLTTAHAGTIVLSGAGAGGEATAVAVIADLVAIARDRAAIVPAPSFVEPREITGLSDQTFAEAV